ncbi:hypothetical protein HHK36_032220 [Tetracentron sinense]|uniref:Uncharacterized protein n=1 Tax=Tetracentron sinense TaxID=13715 RepID=A0A834Y9H0_TETSI|nr:hypothetical protein HHK36_032220 [Tetracentron sinense]
MAKSLRSKREKRLRSIRREIVEPFYEKKDVAKLAVQDAALAAPKLPVRTYTTNTAAAMETSAITFTSNASMDVEMDDGGISHDQKSGFLKPVGGIGKKLKKKLKVGKGKRHGKGKKIRRKHI